MMIIVAGLSLKNLHPRVWDPKSPYHLPGLQAVMVSYGDFHQMPVMRRAAMRQGLRRFLGAPDHIKIFLDNGAFYFLKSKGEADQTQYRNFLRSAKPDWYPIRFDAIPTPKMTQAQQQKCYEKTMLLNRSYQHDGYVPVIHVSRLLEDYINAVKANARLSAKTHLALGGMVPNLLRSRKAMGYDQIIDSLYRVRNEFATKRLHVFGIGGTATLHLAFLLGIDSLDSSGWRNRAARGIVQLPGSGDRTIANFGSWRGRAPSKSEWEELKSCHCPPCKQSGLEGLKSGGLIGFCNRATHNLHVLLEEAKWLKRHTRAGTYERYYQKRLNNSSYLPLIQRLINYRKLERDRSGRR